MAAPVPVVHWVWGAAGSGKTTWINAKLAGLPHSEAHAARMGADFKWQAFAHGDGSVTLARHDGYGPADAARARLEVARALRVEGVRDVIAAAYMPASAADMVNMCECVEHHTVKKADGTFTVE